MMLFLCSVSILASATDYYISSSGNDSANGTSSSTPWRSISKVNSVFSNLRPGDRVLFNRGDVFTGTLQISTSGSSASSITIGAYGTGSSPVFSGFTTITGWTSYGGGIYSKALSCESKPNMVTVNGVNTPIGRWPNTGFLIIDSHSSSTSITDSQLPSSPDWTGAEVVIRTVPYMYDRNTITSHSGTTLYYNSSTGYNAGDGYGYFIQNSLATLDKLGEWYYDGSTFYMYFGSVNPEIYTVRVSTMDQLASMNGKNYITFDNLSFEGANKYGIQINNSDYITVENSSFNFTGGTAIYGPWNGTSSYCKIINNSINNSNDNGIDLNGDHTYATIQNNKISNTGLIIGMGSSGDGTYMALTALGDNGIIQYNTIENTGYVGINFSGNNTVVSYNLIDKFNLVKNDGGGIYTYVGTGTAKSGEKVTNNIVLNGKGLSEGVPENFLIAHGIYMDDRSRNVIISDNTVAYCNTSGMYLHNAHEIEVSRNTMFGNGSGTYDYGSQLLFIHDSYSPDDPIRNISINNNIFFANSTDQNIIAFCTSSNDIPSFGSADNNIYAKPMDNSCVARTWTAGWYSKATNYSLSAWQSYTGKDRNSSVAPIALSDVSKIRFEYNASSSNKTVSLDGGYIDAKGTKYSGSVTLSPYASIVLMVDPNPSTPPASPVYSGSAVENSTPAVLEMTFNLELANIVPTALAFSVVVNSTARSISAVTISGTKVLLTLASPVVYGDVVTVAYIKPSSSPLQTPSGGQAAAISAQAVSNHVNAVSTPPTGTANMPPVVVVNYIPSNMAGFVSVLNASGSYDANKDNLSFTWKVPDNIPVSGTNSPIIQFLAPVTDVSQTYEFTLTVSDGKTTQSKTIPVEILPYQPELVAAGVKSIEASGFQSPFLPSNVLDGDVGTVWSADGIDQWIVLELKEAFSIQHIKIAFQPGQKKEFYFDIYGSTDNITWEPILIKSKSCAFSGNLQVFEFPETKTAQEFTYIKLVGQGNSADTWNHIAEIRIFGYKHRNSAEWDAQIVKVYPNPAHELVNILIEEQTFMPDFIKIVSLAGKVLLQDKIGADVRQFQIPLSLMKGIYIIQMGIGEITMFTQKLIVNY